MKATLLWVLVGCLYPVDGARILTFLPVPAKSHQAVFQPVIRELAIRGHQVTNVTPYKLPNPPPNYKEIIIKDYNKELTSKWDMKKPIQISGVFQSIMLYEMGLFLQAKISEDPEVQKLIHSKDLQFDAVISESLFVQESFTALQHKFNAVGIELQSIGGSCWLNYLMGNPYNPSYILDFKSPFADRMNFLERLINTVTCYGTIAAGNLYYMPKYQALMDKYFNYSGWESRPPLKQLLMDKAIVIQNSDYSTNFAHPSQPHVIDVHGLHIQPSKPLPADLQKFMDEAENGVIYFSFGSNVKVSETTVDDKFKAFVTVFARLKQKVLWKWETDNMADKPANVKTSKWFPQQDILGHKNCRLFITHGGFLSITEAINYGVPLIGVPFLGDQPKNMRQVVEAGNGVLLDFDNITEASVDWAVNEVLKPKYKEAAVLRSKIFNDKPKPGLETAVYWIEYALRHKGAPHLRPALLKLSWWQTMLLDVTIVILLPPVVLVILIYLLVTGLVKTLRSKYIVSRKNKKKDNAKKVN